MVRYKFGGRLSKGKQQVMQLVDSIDLLNIPTVEESIRTIDRLTLQVLRDLGTYGNGANEIREAAGETSGEYAVVSGTDTERSGTVSGVSSATSN